MAVQTKITWEEFQAAGDQETQQWEWVNGEIEFLSENIPHKKFVSLLVALLVQFCDSHTEWDTFGSNAVFTMTSGNWRMPDASLVKKKRFPPGDTYPNKADFAPAW